MLQTPDSPYGFFEMDQFRGHVLAFQFAYDDNGKSVQLALGTAGSGYSPAQNEEAQEVLKVMCRDRAKGTVENGKILCGDCNVPCQLAAILTTRIAILRELELQNSREVASKA